MLKKAREKHLGAIKMKFSIQKTTFWNRIAAALLDFILLMIVSAGAMTLVGWISGYDKYATEVKEIQTKYEEEYGVKFSETEKYVTNKAVVTEKRALYESKNGVKFSVTPEQYAELPAEQKPAYTGENYANDYANMLAELNGDKAYVDAFKVVDAYDQAQYAFNNDKDAIYATSMSLSIILAMISLGVLIGYVVIDFILPLIFKNGQTLGKKIFGIAVMHQDGVRINGAYLFIRTLLGKFAFETMIPLLMLLMFYFMHNLIALIACGAIFLIEIILLFATQYRQPIHDLLAKTITVDIKTQKFFDNEEDRLRYIQEDAAEKAEKSKYF